jgi:hypothetical protein
MTANDPSSSIANRRGTLARDTTLSRLSRPTIGSVGSNVRTTRRTAGASAEMDPLVRTT